MGYGFAFISVLCNLFAGLLLLFSLILVINLLVYRSFKFPHITGWTYLGSVCGTLLATGILGTLWNYMVLEYEGWYWYDNFIHMPLYGAFLGGYPGRFIGELIQKKVLLIAQKYLIAIFWIAIALAAFYSYFYTGAFRYENYD